jgi:hypothetical protein
VRLSGHGDAAPLQVAPEAVQGEENLDPANSHSHCEEFERK